MKKEIRRKLISPRKLAATVLSGVALVALAACSQPEEASQEEAEPVQEVVTAQDVQEEFAEATAVLKEYGYDQREEFVDYSRGQLAELDAEIQDLQARAESEMAGASDATRQEWQELMADLQSQRDQLATSLDETADSSAEAWVEVRNGFLAAQDELASSLQRAAEKFEGGDSQDASS